MISSGLVTSILRSATAKMMLARNSNNKYDINESNLNTKKDQNTGEWAAYEHKDIISDTCLIKPGFAVTYIQGEDWWKKNFT